MVPPPETPPLTRMYQPSKAMSQLLLLVTAPVVRSKYTFPAAVLTVSTTVAPKAAPALGSTAYWKTTWPGLVAVGPISCVTWTLPRMTVPVPSRVMNVLPVLAVADAPVPEYQPLITGDNWSLTHAADTPGSDATVTESKR